MKKILRSTLSSLSVRMSYVLESIGMKTVNLSEWFLLNSWKIQSRDD